LVHPGSVPHSVEVIGPENSAQGETSDSAGLGNNDVGVSGMGVSGMGVSGSLSGGKSASGSLMAASLGAPTSSSEAVASGQAGRALPVKAMSQDLHFYYGKFHALKGITLPIYENHITALIGPSGCGKSTFLRCFNRMHDLYPDTRYQGGITLQPDNVNIVSREVDAIALRMRVSMVFQKPNPFPKSIFENVAFGPRLRGITKRSELKDEVERALRGGAIWEETKDRLHDNAYRLSGGQQQRLCIARSLACDPEVILFDEPTSALDPSATLRIEELMRELRERVTILVVTHNMHQASRVSDYTAFMYLGELIEFNPTAKLFQTPDKKLTEEYIMGRFG
jgi:phosphate transport system ATP-binding protein